MAADPDAAADVVQAAGGAVWRLGPDDTVEVLLVHRPRYDDWSLPKGKLEAGESFLAAAVREVAEETGLTCEVGPELATIRYRDHKDRPKVVRYWAMTVSAGAFAANDEVDEVRWLALDAAAARLTHPHDADVLRSLPAT